MLANTRSDSGAKTVLITGAGGLLGRSAAARFSRNNWNVVALTRADLDISDEAAVIAIVDSVRPNLVINCAAATDVDRCEREPAWAYKANEEGPRNLTRASSSMVRLWCMSAPIMFSTEPRKGFTLRTTSQIP